jgi:hypothetical protein
VQFANGKLQIESSEFGDYGKDFTDKLLFPTFWALGGHPLAGEGIQNAEELGRLKQEIVAGFDEVASGRQWVIRLDQLTVVVSSRSVSYDGSAQALGTFGIGQLLRGEEWRIAHCAWCGTMFVRKKQGLYCSPVCSQRMRTFKNRNPRRWKRMLGEALEAKLPFCAWLEEARSHRGDPRWREDSRKARSFGLTVDEFRIRSARPDAVYTRCPSPLCAVSHLEIPEHLVLDQLMCRNCQCIFRPKDGEEKS